MEKLHWTIEEVISFVETLIHSNAANNRIMEFYEDYIWNSELDKFNEKYINTYKLILRLMRKEYDGGIEK